MPLFTDQMGRDIYLEKTPRRIISLVPSQTELLYSLGLETEVVGITKFCVHPAEWLATKTRVGGTKQINIQTIKQLQPDLIIANKEENVKEQIEALASDYPVWISDVNNLNDALQMILSVGTITGKSTKAETLIATIENQFAKLKMPDIKPRVCYLIWQNPYMTVGGDTFISHMLQQAGFENIFAHQLRYPVITLEELSTMNYELLLLSSEPYPFSQKHIDELQPLLPGKKILLVDGELFSWYGSRLQYAPEYFRQLQAVSRELRAK